MDFLVWCFVIVSFFVEHASAQLSKECGAPPHYPYTKLDKTVGRKAFYKCEADYISVDGIRTIECVDGRWTKLALKCQKRSCGPPQQLLNGRFDFLGTLLGDEARAVCNDGYTLQGLVAHIICKSTGWSEDRPTCEEKEEGDTAPVIPVETTCRDPSTTDGVVTEGSASVYRHGDTVTFTCSPGFSMTGSQQITCGSEGQWQPEPPKCLMSNALCKPPKNLRKNGRVVEGEKPEYRSGDELSFSCLEFYTLNGSPRVTCAQNGTWTPSPPKCTRSKCSVLNIEHGKTSSNHMRAGSVITVTCEEGYRLRGAPEVVCSKEGEWSETPKCVSEMNPPSGCGQPDYISSATISDIHRRESLFPDGARVRYVCNFGYKWTEGSPYRTCTDGTWTELQMICEAKSCGNAGQIPFGQFIYTGTQFGHTATAVCDEGYHLVGRAIRRCLNGYWDGHQPVCEAVQCEEPPEEPNMRQTGTTEPPYMYGNVVGFQCVTGRLLGSRQLYCTKDGTWSDPFPKCQG